MRSSLESINSYFELFEHYDGETHGRNWHPLGHGNATHIDVHEGAGTHNYWVGPP